ncbi:MAG: hypothetical protein LBH46_04475 [Rickettsiales bacterium]|nr:hypothetical protein [Rickettsiales bacterium]
MKKIIVLLVFVFLASCSTNRVIEVRSPCVSNDDGPCGPRVPVNTWLKNEAVV